MNTQLLGADGEAVHAYSLNLDLGHETLVDKASSFIKDLGVGAFNKIKDFVVGTYRNAEGVILLLGSSIGFSYLIGEIPFAIMLPAFIEGAMVAPVLAVILVIGLLALAKWRQSRGGNQNPS